MCANSSNTAILSEDERGKVLEENVRVLIDVHFATRYSFFFASRLRMCTCRENVGCADAAARTCCEFYDLVHVICYSPPMFSKVSPLILLVSIRLLYFCIVSSTHPCFLLFPRIRLSHFSRGDVVVGFVYENGRAHVCPKIAYMHSLLSLHKRSMIMMLYTVCVSVC